MAVTPRYGAPAIAFVTLAARAGSGHEYDLAAQVTRLALPVRVGGALEWEFLPDEDAQLTRGGQGDELGQPRAGAPRAQCLDAEPGGCGLVDDRADPLRIADDLQRGLERFAAGRVERRVHAGRSFGADPADHAGSV